MKAFLISLFILCSFITEPADIANDEEKNLIDGTSLTYVYEELGTVKVTFSKGMVSYEWIEGAFKGTVGKDFPYEAKKIDKKIYFVHWFESSRTSLVSLVINLKSGTVNSSALLNPKTEEEAILFHHATIQEQNFVEN